VTPTIAVDADEVGELLFESGWTDGLPVIPPTVRRVAQTLDVVDLPPDALLGTMPGRGLPLFADVAAANAVMAGCRAADFPLVVAGIEALLDPEFNANAALTSTGGAALCVIVSGPLAESAGMNGGHNALGPGNRTNATVGRALRLIAMNAFDARPGRMDGASLGNPGRYSLCFAETTPPETWPTLQIELGYDAQDTVLVLAATEAPRQVANHLNPDAAGILATYASAMRSPSSFTCGKGGQAVIVAGPEHAAALARAGLSRHDVGEHLARASRIRPADLVEAGVLEPRDGQHHLIPDADGMLPVVRSADDVLVIAAGGAGAGWSAYIPSWATTLATHRVTRRVRPAGEPMPVCGPDACDVVPRGVTS